MEENRIESNKAIESIETIVVKNLIEMMKTRDYAFPPIVDGNACIAKQRVISLTTRKLNDDGSIVNIKAYIFNEAKISTAIIKDIICNDGNLFDLIIIVHRLPLTTMAKSALNSSCSLRFENFPFANLTYDIRQLVPKHELASRDEINAFDFKKIPIINSKIDPVAKYYGFRRDDLVRITASDGIIEYRRCV